MGGWGGLGWVGGPGGRQGQLRGSGALPCRARLLAPPPGQHPASSEAESLPLRFSWRAGPRQYSKRVVALRKLCKEATITVAPSLYVKNKSDADLEAALEALLEKHGLSANAGGRARWWRGGASTCGVSQRRRAWFCLALVGRKSSSRDQQQGPCSSILH